MSSPPTLHLTQHSAPTLLTVGALAVGSAAVDRAGRAALAGGWRRVSLPCCHSHLSLPFAPSSLWWWWWCSLCLGSVTSARGHLALMCTSTSLGQCFSFEHCQVVSSQPRRCPIEQSALVREMSPLRGSCVEVTCCSGVACLLTGHLPEGRKGLVHLVLLVARLGGIAGVCVLFHFEHML